MKVRRPFIKTKDYLKVQAPEELGLFGFVYAVRKPLEGLDFQKKSKLWIFREWTRKKKQKKTTKTRASVKFIIRLFRHE